MGEKKNKIMGILVFVVMMATNIVLLTNESSADWQQGDDYKMHFPQLPDVYGWDVNATWPNVIADDWMCTGTGYVSDIHFWGSWKNNQVGTINWFWIGIYSNVPATNQTYSHPGDLLWSRTFYPGEWIEVPYETPQYTEGWYDLASGYWNKPDHWNYFQYNIVNITDAFVQWNGTIYWLAISANVTGGSWGWKTSTENWEDDAVWSWGIEYPEWVELWDPQEPGVSLDMSFVITGEVFPCCNKDWDYWTNPPHMWMIPSGNVGIGTRHPQAKLHVNGSVRVDGSTQSYLFFVNANTGKVGIGTNNPTGIFHTFGTAYPVAVFEREYTPPGATDNFLASAFVLKRSTGKTAAPGIGSGFIFETENAAGDSVVTAGVYARLMDVTNGSEDGKLLFAVVENGVWSPTYNQLLSLTKSEVVVNDPGRNVDFRVESDNNPNMLFVDASTDRVGIGTNNPNATLDVEGTVEAYQFNTGDIYFQKDGKKLWRMFEDENGLYVENLETGKIYTIVSRNGNAHANNIGFYMMTIGIGAMIGAAIAIAWRRRN